MADGLVGRSLLNGEYVLREVLGQGGMATVYRAYSRSRDADVAVKVLAPRIAADPGFRERFLDEFRSLANLFHPNLIEVYHYGVEGDVVYIAMRLVPGGTLKDRLKAIDGPLDLVTTARLIQQVADGLQHAHDHGLVHLDVKPANVLLGRVDWPLLADFGITRAIAREETSRGNVRIAGTPAYMSPEQCQGGPIDGRSDQYSLAITAYELLTGRRPFEAQTTEGLLQQHLQAPPPPPRTVNPGIPGPVEAVLLRALSKEPEARYPTIREFGRAFASAVERTRGVTLETKAALAGIAPNLVAALAIVVLGPALLWLLPRSALLENRLPLAWPFQLLLALFLTVVLLGMRWHLTGLLTRGLRSLLRALDQVQHGYVRSSGGDGAAAAGRSWQTAVAGSAEGVVGLGYLFATYRILALPILTLLGVLLDPVAHGIAAAAMAAIVVVGALVFLVGIARSGGGVVTAIVLVLCAALAVALPTEDLTIASGVSLTTVVKAVVALGALIVLAATRRSVHGAARTLAAAWFGRSIAYVKAGAPEAEIAASRRLLQDLMCVLVDFGYLLAGYALVRGAAVDGLERQVAAPVAAGVVSAVAVLIWLLLALRLRALVGTLGLALGVLVGAPLLVSLPIWQPDLVGISWPATAAAWGIGTLTVLLLAASRGQVQAIGQQALGPVLDRGVVGVADAPDEEQHERRVGALGGVVGALFDVALLVVGYWAIGTLAAEELVRASGRREVGSLLLVGLFLAALGILHGPLRRAALTLAETGYQGLGGQIRLLPRLATLLALAAVVGGGAMPAVLAAPVVAGGLALETPSAEPSFSVTVEVKLPSGWSPELARFSATGAPTRSQVVAGDRAVIEAYDVSPGASLAVLVDFSASGGPGQPDAVTVTPSPEPASTATATLAAAAVDATATPTATTTSSPTPTASVTVTPTSSATPTVAATTTSTAVPTATPTAEVAPTATPTATVEATPTIAATPTATATPLPPSPTATRQARTGPCEAPVLAMYYAWYDENTWTSGRTSDLPVEPYVSHDRAVIERQVTQAKSVGIDGFELNWWGPDNPTDTNLQTLLDVAQAHGFKVTADYDMNSPFIKSPEDVAAALNYLKRYFDHPAWFRYQGKPMVVFYGIRKYDQSTWATIRRQVDPNGEAIWMGEGDIFTYLNVFDGIHPYSIAWSSDPARQLASYARQTRQYPGKIWMATVMPGYDDTRSGRTETFAVDRRNGAFYETTWDGALATNPDIISISSWNEWVEGHQIEASRTYGDLYLRLTAQRIPAFKQAKCG